MGIVRPPIVREGLETEKQLAKLAFKNLSLPIKNLFLGLTDIETNLAKSQKMVQECIAQQQMDAFEAHIDLVLQKMSHTQESLLDLFRECENRVIQEWTLLVNEKEIAEVTFLLVQVVHKMNEEAKKCLDEASLEMYFELRADHDAISSGPSVFVSNDVTNVGTQGTPSDSQSTKSEDLYKL